MARLRTWVAGWWTAMLAGALFLAVVVRAIGSPLAHVVPMAFVGALIGLVILGLIRAFGTRRWGYVVAGLLAGPFPFLLMEQSETTDDRGGALVGGLILGLAIGLLEWARVSSNAGPQDERSEAAPPSDPSDLT